MAKKKKPEIEISAPTGILVGYAVLFGNYETEFWKHNPSVLTKQQRAKLGIIGYRPVSEIIELGDTDKQTSCKTQKCRAV